MNTPDRRDFTAAALATMLGTPLLAQTTPKPTLDLHVHLFGTGDSGSGCRLSDGIQNGVQFRALTLALGIRSKGKTLDEGYVNVLAEQVKLSGLTKVAILSQDAVYDAKGEADWKTTSFYVPNEYVIKVAEQHKETIIPCPSINPARKDAIDELEHIHSKGAKLFKIHPPTQGVNVADPRHTKFYQRCAALKIVIMVHTGHEHSAPVIDKDLANPARLELMLDQGPTVIACHSGTGWPTDTPDQLPNFTLLLKRYPNLWGDTAVLGTAKRDRDFYRLLDAPTVRDRLLHGSDFPFPVSPSAFEPRIGKEAVQAINKEKSWIGKDYQLKKALNIGQISAERAWQVVLGA
ncbi:MAG TPA: amidohydrolase family protein [Gemmatales bacterium]|nr:amidohydrolase family protein [Gemmatales bacterium]